MRFVTLQPFCVVTPQADALGWVDPREEKKQAYILQCKRCRFELMVKYPVDLPLANIITDLKAQGWRFSATEGLVSWCPQCAQEVV